MSDPCPRCDETSGFNGTFCKACGYDLELEAADHAGEGADLGEFSYEDFVQASGLQEPTGSPWGWILGLTLIGCVLLAWRVPGFRSLGIVFTAVLGVGIFVWAIRRAGGSVGGSAGAKAKGGYLCDGCKYDDARYCGRPERPNATTCPDFKAR